MAGQPPTQFRLISETVTSPTSMLHIRCPTNDGDRKLFWISLLRDKSISIGCFDKNFAVRQLAGNGEPLVATEKVVKKPHVTLHSFGQAYEGFYHLRAENDEPIIRGLTWGSQGLAGEPSKWLRWVTNPLRSLPTATGSRSGKSATVWRLTKADATCSAVLFLDFVDGIKFENEHDAMVSRFIKWGNFLLKLRVGTVPERDGAIELTTYG